MNTPSLDDTPPGLLDARQIAYDIAMRAKWRKQKLVSAGLHKRKQEAFDWRARVESAYAESMQPGITPDRLYSLYTLLSFHLLTAPTEEEATWLYERIGELKSKIVKRPKLRLV
ncbi:MAG: hypothetical protein K2W95_34245 [Candidatus Obscuribacterales bacterium]|nr:hypothetical protein [Candidatus Obscuribacterales bacterium]